MRWLIALLVIVSGTAASFLIKSPIYSFGIGVVIAAEQNRPENQVRLAVFLPAQTEDSIRPGDEITVRVGTQTMERRVISVDSQVLSPDEIHARYRIGAAADGLITQPARVVIADFESAASGTHAGDYLGSVYQVTVVAGTRRTLLAMVKQLFAPRETR